MGGVAATIDGETALDSCLTRARRSAFYADRLENSIDASGFNTLGLTRKADLRERGPAAFVAVDPQDLFQYHESFGTTGRTSGSWFTRVDYANDLERVRDWTAPFTHARVLIRFPYALSMPAHLAQRAVELRRGAVIAGSSRNEVCTCVRAVRMMADLEVEVLACSPFEAMLLAETADRLGIRRPPIRALCVAGELLSGAYRRLLEDAWGVPIYNLYGSTETGALATSCLRNRLHVCEGQLVEILSEDLPHTPLPAGEIGLVVVTTLDREAMPLIRYVTGDYGRWLSSDACGCGRPGIVVEPLGRFLTRLTEYPTERDVQDLACTVASSVQGRFFVADVHGAGMTITVETDRAHDLDDARESGVVVRSVAVGTVIDRQKLLAEPTARKAELVRMSSVSR